MEDKYIDYRIKKLGLFIMFNETNNDYTNKPYLLSPTVILYLMKTLKPFAEKELLSNDIKNNIYNYLYQAREIYDENREKRIELVNEIIKMMNRSATDDTLVYYKIELYKRQDNKKCLSYSKEKVKSEMSNIKKSICNDFLIFMAQNELFTTEEEFIRNELQNLIDNPLYYNSINAFLYEKPQLFTDPTFYNRTIFVLKSKEEKYNNSNIKNSNKKFLRDMKKLIKYMKKTK